MQYPTDNHSCPSIQSATDPWIQCIGGLERNAEAAIVLQCWSAPLPVSCPYEAKWLPRRLTRRQRPEYAVAKCRGAAICLLFCRPLRPPSRRSSIMAPSFVYCSYLPTGSCSNAISTPAPEAQVLAISHGPSRTGQQLQLPRNQLQATHTVDAINSLEPAIISTRLVLYQLSLLSIPTNDSVFVESRACWLRRHWRRCLITYSPWWPSRAADISTFTFTARKDKQRSIRPNDH